MIYFIVYIVIVMFVVLVGVIINEALFERKMKRLKKNMNSCPANSTIYRDFCFRIDGLTELNENGTNRQDLIKNLPDGTKLAIYQELSYPHNPCGLKIIHQYARDALGYVPKDMAKIIDQPKYTSKVMTFKLHSKRLLNTGQIEAYVRLRIFKTDIIRDKQYRSFYDNNQCEKLDKSQIIIPIKVAKHGKRRTWNADSSKKAFVAPTYEILDIFSPLYCNQQTVEERLQQLSTSSQNNIIDKELIPRVAMVNHNDSHQGWPALFIGNVCIGKIEFYQNSNNNSDVAKCEPPSKYFSYHLMVHTVEYIKNNGHLYISLGFEPKGNQLVPQDDYISMDRGDKDFWIGTKNWEVLLLDRRLPCNDGRERLFFVNKNRKEDEGNFQTITMTVKEWNSSGFHSAHQNKVIFSSIMNAYKKYSSTQKQYIYQALLEAGKLHYANSYKPKKIELYHYLLRREHDAFNLALDYFLKSDETSFYKFTQLSYGNHHYWIKEEDELNELAFFEDLYDRFKYAEYDYNYDDYDDYDY